MTRRIALKVALVILGGVAALCVTAISWVQFAPRHVPSGQPALVTLDAGAFDSFRDTFNSGEGEVRLLVMLSPT